MQRLLGVPKAGIEPARVLPHWFLRPTRLPIPPLRLSGRKNTLFFISTAISATKLATNL